MKKVYVETYGCTLNGADSDIIKGVVQMGGHSITASQNNADVVILNTCTVKGSTENKILDRIKSLKDKKLVVAGCLSVNEDRIRKINPNVVIMHPGAIKKSNQAIKDVIDNKKTTYKEIERKDELPRFFTKPILRVPIQDGCASSCNFCQTKQARPKLISYKKERLISWIEFGVLSGAKEVQLTGMDCGAYGLDRKTNLVDLLDSVCKIDGEFKVRIGMANPKHVKRMLDGIVRILENEKFYKFIHIPVQSGSEKVCKEMNRDDNLSDFEISVGKIRKRIPDVTISTDIIVGYPTETEDDFEKTIELIKRIKPGVVNISKFTPRPGTKAKELKQLDTKIIKERSLKLTQVCREMQIENNKQLIGRVYEVIITEKQKDWTGRNENYKQVVVKNFKGSIGEKIKVKINDARDTSLIGNQI